MPHNVKVMTTAHAVTVVEKARSQACWLMLAISVLERPKQEDCQKFQASLDMNKTLPQK